MRQRLPVRHRTILLVEPLESRLALDGRGIVVTGTPQNGPVVHTVQSYVTNGGQTMAVADSLFDSDLVSIVFSSKDGASIRRRVVGGAELEGVFGRVIGDVSERGNVVVGAVSLPMQAFLARPESDLPTLTGTPILNPSSAYPRGAAALMFPSVAQPELQLVNSGTPLPIDNGISEEIRVPVSLEGPDNHEDPGNQITLSPRPFVQVSLTAGPLHMTARNQHFIGVDTGSQVTVIDTGLAQELGIDVGRPPGGLNGGPIDPTCDIQVVPTNGGANGVPGDCGVATLDELDLDSDHGIVRFINPSVLVLDLHGLASGIVGMNLFAGMSALMFDPFGGPWFSFPYVVTDAGANNISVDSQIQLVVEFSNAVSPLSYNSARLASLISSDSPPGSLGENSNGSGLDSAMTGQVAVSPVTFPDSSRQAIDRFHQNSAERSTDVLGQETLSTLGGMGALSPNDAS